MTNQMTMLSSTILHALFIFYFLRFEYRANAHAEAGMADGVRAAMAAATASGIQLTSHYHTLLVKALWHTGKAKALDNSSANSLAA